jgi:peptidoglycan LD-endopeptidase CwlK
MAKFGAKSLERLATCHTDLQRIMHELVKELDVTILCGYRNEQEQRAAFIAGHSKLMYPNSKHNKSPSRAVDVAPYSAKVKGVDWKDIPAFEDMCKRIERIAKELGVKIKLGRDFSFKDYPHVELSDKNKT